MQTGLAPQHSGSKYPALGVYNQSSFIKVVLRLTKLVNYLPNDIRQNMTLPPLRSLHYFSVAATSTTLGEASAKLFVTRAALSQQIKKLEDFLSVKLFSRSGATLQLTEEGKALLPYIQSGMSQFQQGIYELKHLSSNTLTVSSPHSICTFILAPKISSLQLAEPQMTVHLVPNNSVLTYDDFSADVAIRVSASSHSEGLEYREVADCSYVLAYSPLIFGSDEELVKKIYDIPFLLDDSPDINTALKFFCTKEKINVSKLNITMRVNDSVPIVLNILAGVGIGIVNELLVHDLISQGAIKYYAALKISGNQKLSVVAPPANFKNDNVAKFVSWLFSVT